MKESLLERLIRLRRQASEKKVGQKLKGSRRGVVYSSHLEQALEGIVQPDWWKDGYGERKGKRARTKR